MAFDVKTGARLWETATGQSFRESRGNGPRGTPTIEGDRAYAMAADGLLACLEAGTGKVIWSQNVVQKYGGAGVPLGTGEEPPPGRGRVVLRPRGPGRLAGAHRQAPVDPPRETSGAGPSVTS